MNILELSAYFYPHKGGIETVIYNLAKEWTQNKNNTTVITSNQNSNKKYDLINGIRVHYLKSFKFIDDIIFLSLFKKIKQLNNKNKFDIALIHHPHPFTLFFGAYTCKKNNIPYCVHMHGKELVLKGYKKIFSSIFNKIFLKYVLSNAKKIFICVNKIKQQSKILKKYNKKIITIPHGINFKEFNFNNLRLKSQLKKQLKLENKKIILYLGVLRDYKRLDILIKAMPKIIQQISNILLIIAGRGPEEKKLKQLSNELKLNNHMIFFEYFPDDLKCKYYKAADLFVLPSPTIMESFGLVAFEAFSMKTPVIVTNGAGMGEIFKKEKMGVTIEPFSSENLANNAVKLLKNKNYSTKITNKAYEIIKQKYQWKDIAQEYLMLFRKILRK